MNAITLFLTVIFAVVGVLIGLSGHLYAGIVLVIIAILISAALKMANVWERFVILRAGKLLGTRGPGLFLIIPIIDSIVAVIDQRIQTTAFSAEAALTKDTVPVNVDAIIFWFVHDAEKAALNIANYREAIDRVAQTSLREMIGSSMLSALLSERAAADELLRAEIGGKIADWGISVNSVEIRDVAIPVALQDAMSRQAQAEREKQARVILGSAEAAIAASFVEASVTYEAHPQALQLRAMNIIYETTKERGATILMPTSMVDSMNPAVALAVAETAAPQGGEAHPAAEVEPSSHGSDFRNQIRETAMAEKLDSAAQKVTPRDAQKGGQGALSKDHPEIQLKEDAPLTGDVPAQGEQASALSKAQIELLADIGERDLSNLSGEKRQCLEQLLADGYIARLDGPPRFRLTVKGTDFLSERGAGLNEA